MYREPSNSFLEGVVVGVMFCALIAAVLGLFVFIGTHDCHKVRQRDWWIGICTTESQTAAKP